MGDLIRQTVGVGGVVTVGGGRYFRIVKAISPVDVVFEFDGATKRVSNIDAGYSFGPLPDREWKRVRITSSAAQEVILFNGEDAEDYGRTLQVVQVETANAIYANKQACPVGAYTPLLPNQSQRRRALVQVDPDAGGTAVVYLTNNGGGTTGHKLKAGGQVEVFTKGEVFIWNPAGASVDVYVYEERYV